jgi:ribosomal protein L22
MDNLANNNAPYVHLSDIRKDNDDALHQIQLEEQQQMENKVKTVTAKLKTVNIKGKEYVEVNQRIKAFREIYPNGSIMTEIISHQDGVWVMKAVAVIDNQIVATGHAYEKEGSTFINKTSYIENAETSAIGRCLGCLGIGIDTSVASVEEVANAIKQQGGDPF